MKKIGAILLVLCMLMSVIAVPSFAETPEPVVIDATAEVKSFYDNGMNGGNGSLELLYGKLMLRPCGEWVTYDISALTPGTYSVDMLYRLNGNVSWKSLALDFVVDGILEQRAYISHTGGWKDAAATINTGKIYIPEGAAELKVKNIGIYPVSPETFTLTYVGAEDTTEDILVYGQNVTSSPNAAKTGHEFYLGVDYWDAATGTDTTFTKEDENGNMHLPLTSSKTFETTKLVQHAGDWTRYDISDFKEGTYEVTLNRAQKSASAKYNLKIDGKTALQTTIDKTSDVNYSTYAEVVLGKIYISEDNDYLTLLNEGAGSVYVDYMKFKYISSERDEETIPSKTFNGVNVIPGGQGVGFYGNSVNNGNAALETNNTQAVLRQGGEWLAYDISDLENGTYTLDLSYTVREDMGFYLDIYVDDILQAKIKPPITTNGLGGAPDTIEACNIIVNSDTKVLKIRNSSRCVTNICGLALNYASSDLSGDYAIRQYGDHASLHDADGKYAYISGEDFYDLAGRDITGRMEKGIYISDKSDWVRYDINGLKAGTYRVTYNYASRAASFVKFKVDGNIMLTKALPATADTYGTYADISLGNVYIPEDTEYFVLQNDGDGTIYSNYIEFELISENQTAWPSFGLRASDVIPGGQGVGFNDTSDKGALEYSYSNIALRPKEWLKFDVSNIKPGTYSLSLNNSSTADMDFAIRVDDKLHLKVKTYKTGSSWSDATYEDNYLGDIYIGEDTETITIENVHVSATSYISLVLFDNVSDEDETFASINILATDVLKDEGEIVEGISYYDAGGEGKFEPSGSGIVLRQGDWNRYDLAALGLDEGIYTVYASLSTDAASLAGVSVEGEEAQRLTAITDKTASYDEVEIGKIVVSDSTSYFTVSCEHGQRIILYSLRLVNDVYEDTTVTYTSDAEGNKAVSSLSDLEKVYVTVDVIRPDRASIGETVYVALYSGDKLISVQLDPVTEGYRYTNTFEVSGLDETSTVKTFIWESDEYIPVISSADTTISAQ